MTFRRVTIFTCDLCGESRESTEGFPPGYMYYIGEGVNNSVFHACLKCQKEHPAVEYHKGLRQKETK